MTKDFRPFANGDIVGVHRDFPYAHPMLFEQENWTIQIMIPEAGVVVLEEIGKSKTFPVDAFYKVKSHETDI